MQCTNMYSEEFEDTKVAIKIRKSKKTKQPNGQRKEDKTREKNDDLQNVTIKLKIE